MLYMALGKAAKNEKYLIARATPNPESCMPISNAIAIESLLEHLHNLEIK